MALIDSNEVQLRISTTADGQGEVNALSNSISDLEKDFNAVGIAARDASAKQAEAAQKLQAAKVAQDALRDALAAAKNEYQTLSASAKQSGTSQADFAAQAATAKQRVADLKTELLTASGNVRKLNTEYSGAANETKRLAAEHQRLATSMTAAGKEAVDMSTQVNSIGKSISEVKMLYAAWIGLQQGANMVAGVAATADAYTNLQAKLKLAVGDGEALASAFKGVQEVALSTNSSLESTGTLFAKIAGIGKTMGVSNEEALRLTETINQAIQLSGASAQSSDAAITQLIQGLQSGVVRGDEFNSIMEQSPRLAKALSDGLGVTTGELRKMAEAGQLTAETVIGALKGQAAAVEGEFAQLPATIGRAITTLETQWKLWIGTMDESTGASATAAAAIEGLANNFDLVASSLMNAGQAYLGWKAYNIAAEFLGLKTAVAASTAAKTADTGATIANTAATAANTTAQVANNAAKTGAAGAADSAALAAGRLAGALSLIKGLSFAFLITNIVDIGKWLGEAAAKAMGYGKVLQDAEIQMRAMEAATKAEADANAALSQKMKLASDAALGLGIEGKKLVAAFDELKLKGETTGEAIAKMAKEFNLQDVSGIEQAGAALDKLAQQGKLSADEVRLAWQKALDGKDLQQFSIEADLAFTGAVNGAERLAHAMDASLNEAIRRTGKDFGELSNGINKAAVTALNDFDVLISRVDDLGKKGVEVGLTLQTSLEKALSAATTEAAIKQVIERFNELGNAGLLAGDKVAEGIKKAQDKLDAMLPGINSIDEAFKQLGMKSPAELDKVAASAKSAFDTINAGTQRSTEGLQVISQAFVKYAEAALAANGNVVTDAMRVEAAMAGVEIKVDAAGKAMFVYKDAADAAAASSSNAADAAGRQANEYDKVAAAAAKAADEKKKLADIEEKARNAQRAPVELDAETILMRNGASIEEAKQGAQYFNPLMTQRNLAGQGVGDPEGQARAVAAEAIARAKEDLLTDEQKAQIPGTKQWGERFKAMSDSAPSAPSAPEKTPFLTPTENAKTVNVKIDMGNKSTQIKVASQQDANALTDLLRQLESDALRT